MLQKDVDTPKRVWDDALGFRKDTMKLKMLKGLPASGKTTKAREMVVEYGSAGRINRDDLRAMLYDSKWSGSREQVVIDCEKAIAQVLIKHKQVPIIDDTNLFQSHLDMWRNFAKENGAEFETVEMDSNYWLCIVRNKLRENKVPNPVITYMAFKAGLIKIANEIIIFDIDGTLADGRHREHFVTGGGKKDWASYYSLLHLDEPIEIVCNWLRHEYNSGRTVVIVSGRPDTYSKDTEQWLWENELFYHYLFMRKGSDKREDSIIKSEILDLLPKDQIVCAVDDRPRVLRMWQERGIRVVPVRGQCEDF